MGVRRVFVTVALLAGGIAGAALAPSAQAAPPPSPVTVGFATISNLSINGVVGTTATVAPGSTVTITATVTDNTAPHTCANFCIDYVPVGLRGAPAPAGCLEVAGRGGKSDPPQTNTVQLTAPSTAGSYDVVAEANRVFSCSSGWTGGATDTAIAVLKVAKVHTNTALTCTPTSPSLNQPTTCTATVTPAIPDTTPITGTVTFYDNGVAVATVPVVNGHAAYTAPYSASGHSIYAVYNGDGNYLASGSSNTVTTSSPCTTTYTGSHGSVYATSGVNCVSSATVGGDVDVTRGASLDIENSTVSGSVQASKPAAIRICGSTITGNVYITGATGPVVIGDPANGCAANIIRGRVIVASSTGSVTIVGNTISGTITTTGDTGGLTVSGNHGS